MSMKPNQRTFFSIVIPTYQRANLIRETIQSVLNQTYHLFEVIIVDDGGNDNTEEVINQLDDGRLKYFWKENQERGAARNFGIQKSKGDYIFFLDSDDLIKPKYLDYANELINKHGNPAALHIPYNSLVEGVEIASKKLPTDITKHIFIQNLFACQVIVKSELAKTTLFSENRNFVVGEDWYYIIKIAAKHKFVIGEKNLGLIVQHSARGMNDVSYYKVMESKEIFVSQLKEIPNLPVFAIKNVNYEFTNLASLQAVLQNKKYVSLILLLRSIFLNPWRTFRRRNFAIIKKLFIPRK